MSEHITDTIGQILWVAMFLTPLIAIPFVWKFFKVQKVFRVIFGLVLAGIMSYFLYHISLALIFKDGFGATVTANPPKTAPTSTDSTSIIGNTKTTISTDIEQLGKLLNLKKHKPTLVKYKYVSNDNGAQHERLTVPGPSDYSLQALLYFDSLTFDDILDYARRIDYFLPKYNKSIASFSHLTVVGCYSPGPCSLVR
jgi:hypothetical protein